MLGCSWKTSEQWTQKDSSKIWCQSLKNVTPWQSSKTTITDDRTQELDSLSPRLYLCITGRRRLRSLHRLRSCWMVPGIGSYLFAFLPREMRRQNTTKSVIHVPVSDCCRAQM